MCCYNSTILYYITSGRGLLISVYRDDLFDAYQLVISSNAMERTGVMQSVYLVFLIQLVQTTSLMQGSPRPHCLWLHWLSIHLYNITYTLSVYTTFMFLCIHFKFKRKKETSKLEISFFYQIFHQGFEFFLLNSRDCGNQQERT